MKELAHGLSETDPQDGFHDALDYVIHLPSERVVMVYTGSPAVNVRRIYNHLVALWSFQPTFALEQLRLLFPYSLDLIDQLEDQELIKSMEKLL